jgi:hypothetical protein
VTRASPMRAGTLHGALRHTRVVKHKCAQEPAPVFAPRMAGRPAMRASDRELTAEGRKMLQIMSSSLLAGPDAAGTGQVQTRLAQRSAALASMTALGMKLWT